MGKTKEQLISEIVDKVSSLLRPYSLSKVEYQVIFNSGLYSIISIDANLVVHCCGANTSLSNYGIHQLNTILKHLNCDAFISVKPIDVSFFQERNIGGLFLSFNKMLDKKEIASFERKYGYDLYEILKPIKYDEEYNKGILKYGWFDLTYGITHSPIEIYQHYCKVYITLPDIKDIYRFSSQKEEICSSAPSIFVNGWKYEKGDVERPLCVVFEFTEEQANKMKDLRDKGVGFPLKIKEF